MTDDSRIALSAQEIEASLIAEHWQYGSLIHESSADALVAALAVGASEPAAGHALFARLFGEYVASLETFAAWCWALSERSIPGSFLDSYLGYVGRDVGGFYTVVRDCEADPIELLRLPPCNDIVKTALERFAEHRGDVSVAYTDSLAALSERMAEAAHQYFNESRVVVDAYNKTKHGAPMVRLFEPGNPRTFELVMRNTNAARAGEPVYQFASFVVSRETITRMHTNVRAMTLSIRDLASLTKMLLDAGLLFDATAW